MAEGKEEWNSYMEEREISEKLNYMWVVARQLDRIFFVSHKNPAYYAEGVEQYHDLIDCYATTKERERINKLETEKRTKLDNLRDHHGNVNQTSEFKIIRHYARRKMRILMQISKAKGLVPVGKATLTIGNN